MVGVFDGIDFDQPMPVGKSINIIHWKELPWEIRVKTYLAVYSVDWEAKLAKLSPRETNICRWAALFLHIGCAKKSKTSKIYIYSFLSALFMIKMFHKNSLQIEVTPGQ